MKGGSAFEVKRTSHSVLRLRCVERTELGGASANYPVKLIIFDFDETLTLVTLMSEDGQYTAEQEFWAREVNFETPWVEGSRSVKLKNLFDKLIHGHSGEKRILACLTRNGNANGVGAVLNLMRAADLDGYFTAIWALPYRPGRSCGAYQCGGKWIPFDPPLRRVMLDHKADVLQHMADNPKAWFPQIGSSLQSDVDVQRLADLHLAEIVLVDDQRSNFQSGTGAKALRYCKVARYDAVYRDFGLLRDMGGIGAHDDADYDTLKRFVEDPWMCKDTYQVRCQERDFEGSDEREPVTLIVFDFDETLTLATFMPTDKAFAENVGWKSKSQEEWSEAELLEYNFESPFVIGSRVAKLREMLQSLTSTASGGSRTFAVLSRNDLGVFAVQNLLSIAGLADFFSAIWTLSLSTRPDIPNGLFRTVTGDWKPFEPPLAEIYEHKADILHHVASHPSEWFPQLKAENGTRLPDNFQLLKRLRLEHIVLVDDERANFRSESPEQAKVLRYCKVARYDEVYRDCGALNQMGGIGAHNDTDYETLKTFCEHPWEFPYLSSVKAMDGEQEVNQHGLQAPSTTEAEVQRKASEALCRDSAAGEAEPAKVPRVRKGTGPSPQNPKAVVPPAGNHRVQDFR